jgi:thioredoxin 1
MISKYKWVLLIAIAVVLGSAAYAVMQVQGSSETPKVAAGPLSLSAEKTGRVTMIDLGATECIPCKMMAPILEELKQEYAGKADIIFIDVWKNPDQARKYGIRAIPTQIFYDAEGREVQRHTGFMDKKRIVEILTRLGVS